MGRGKARLVEEREKAEERVSWVGEREVDRAMTLVRDKTYLWERE